MSWIFTHNEDDTVRYTLGKLGKNNLICIGINPSTAVPDDLDVTLKRVSKIASLNGYDGWLMLNIYPQRDPYPKNIHVEANVKIIKDNCSEIKRILSDYNFSDVWAGWGTEIKRQPFLINCLKEIVDCFNKNYRWLNYGSLTKKGHPKHPSRISYSDQFFDFDIVSYLNTELSKRKVIRE